MPLGQKIFTIRTWVAFQRGATYVFFLSLLLFFVSACGKQKPTVSDIAAEAAAGYEMYTTDVNVLVSDSGLTQYHIKAKKWYIYKDNNPRWYFPAGFFAEQIDTLGNAKASLQSDTAYQFIDKEEWLFIGHVVVKNRSGDTFLAKRLLWQKATQQVSSTDSVTVITPERTLTGTGFTATQDFSRYTFYNNSGIVDVPKDEDTEAASEPNQTEAPTSSRFPTYKPRIRDDASKAEGETIKDAGVVKQAEGPAELNETGTVSKGTGTVSKGKRAVSKGAGAAAKARPLALQS